MHDMTSVSRQQDAHLGRSCLQQALVTQNQAGTWTNGQSQAGRHEMLRAALTWYGCSEAGVLVPLEAVGEGWAPAVER